MAAGIIWIIVGSMQSLLAIGMAGLAVIAGRAQSQLLAMGLVLAVVIALVSVAFLYVGVQTVRARARDTLGNGIGSIILGLLAAASGGATLAGLGLISAGILALVARNDYKDFVAQGAMR
jgi:hypothetical protein